MRLDRHEPVTTYGPDAKSPREPAGLARGIDESRTAGFLLAFGRAYRDIERRSGATLLELCHGFNRAYFCARMLGLVQQG